MKQQADQTAKALKEQSRAMKDMSVAAANTAKQIKIITAANRDHSHAAGGILQDLGELRVVTERNASGVRQTRQSTADLLRSAQALSTMIGSLTAKPH